MQHPAFGPIIQNGFVVRDLDAAVQRWLALGVGPFFTVRHVGYKRASYRGQDSSVDYAIAMANWGDIQIELIAQNCDSPSIYREFLDEGGDGLHHMLTTVPDLSAVKAGAAAGTYEILAEVEMEPFGGVLYMRAPGIKWPLIEVGQFAPPIWDIFAMIKAASQNWDGSDPVRPIG